MATNVHADTATDDAIIKTLEEKLYDKYIMLKLQFSVEMQDKIQFLNAATMDVNEKCCQFYNLFERCLWFPL